MTAVDAPAPALPPQFALGGRLFEPVRVSTFRHDVYLSELVERAGLGTLVAQATTGGEFPQLAMASLGELYRRGVLFELLGAVVTEVGKPWSPATAKAHADLFAELTDPEEKQLLARVLMETLAGFFASGVGSSGISDPSSPAPAPGPESAWPSDGPPHAEPDSPATAAGTP